jgi:hypothetical protein
VPLLPIIENPQPQQWKTLLSRPVFHSETLDAIVSNIPSGLTGLNLLIAWYKKRNSMRRKINWTGN